MKIMKSTLSTVGIILLSCVYYREVCTAKLPLVVNTWPFTNATLAGQTKYFVCLLTTVSVILYIQVHNDVDITLFTLKLFYKMSPSPIHNTGDKSNMYKCILMIIKITSQMKLLSK